MALRTDTDLGRTSGFTIVELMLALFVVMTVVLATFTVFDTSKRATRVSESQEGEIHQAQQELERLQALPYGQLALTSAPSTSTNTNNPDYYVSASPSAACPSFTWNQSAGANATDQLIVDGCTYNGLQQQNGTITSSRTANGYTVHDYVTWVSDGLCIPGVGCPVNDDYKRITVEVTGNQSPSLGPTAPVMVSAIATDPHALPVVGNPNVNNPLNSTTVTCANGSGQQVQCNNGLGNLTPHVLYLTNSLEQNGYSAPSADNSCMHYTDQQLPLLGGALNCGGANLGVCSLVLGLVGCPQPDLLNLTPPPASISQEYDFSPNLAANTAGRVMRRDPNATSCSSTPSNDASTAEFWATQPLSTSLNLSGSGAMTLYTNTLHGLAVNVTLCVAIYLENPVLNSLNQLLPILDPLNLLHSGDSVRLGVVAYTVAQWPAIPTPLSFTFNYMGAAQLAAAGTSIGVRLWLTAGSGDDVLVHYDAPSVASSVELNSQ